MPDARAWAPEEDEIVQQTYRRRADAVRALAAAGFHRSVHAVDGRRQRLNRPRLRKFRVTFTAGAGRQRRTNEELWRLAEKRPTPAEYERERARIVNGGLRQ